MTTLTNSKPVTKFVLLKVTYNSYYIESPETWDWNQLIDSSSDENAEIVSVTEDFPEKT